MIAFSNNRNGHTTLYAGTWFRSKLEAQFALFFDRLDIRWWYERYVFQIGKWNYTPDFLVHFTWSERQSSRRLNALLWETTDEMFDLLCEDSDETDKTDSRNDSMTDLEEEPTADLAKCDPAAFFIEVKPIFVTERWESLLHNPTQPLIDRDGEWQFLKAHQVACAGYKVIIMSGEYFCREAETNAIPMLHLPMMLKAELTKNFRGAQGKIPFLRAMSAARGMRFSDTYTVQVKQ